MKKGTWGVSRPVDEGQASLSPPLGVRLNFAPEWIGQGMWVGEGALVGLAGLAFGWAAVDPLGSSIAFFEIPGSGITAMMVIVLAGFLAWASLGLSGAYNSAMLTRPAEGIFRILAALCLVFAALVIVLLLAAQPIPIWILGWFAASVVALPTARLAVGWLLARVGASGRATALVVGSECDRKTLRRIVNSRDDGFTLLGVSVLSPEALDPESRSLIEALPVRRFADPGDMVSLGRSNLIDQVIVVDGFQDSRCMDQVLQWFECVPIDILAAGGGFGGVTAGAPSRMVAGMPMVTLRVCPLTLRQRVIKRASDVVLASALSILFAPLMAVIAAWIKIESPGPVFFTQRREGLNGELFTMLKFRTMYQEFEDRDASLLVCRNDKRVTPGGRVLRRFSLDELPQFLNVLRGSMSVVGPRPHAVSARAANRPYREVVSDYGQRHRVKPGMTGLAQVRGWRGETDTVDKIIGRVECDLDYVDHWSFGRDLWIMFLTIGTVLSGRNSF